MKSLRDLPAELLGRCLYGKATSFVAITLWLTGDRQLQQKLATGLEFIALLDQSTASSSRFPKMLWSLRNLRYLSIDRDRGSLASSVRETQAFFRQLTCPKLETLILRCDQAGDVFRLLTSDPLAENPSLDTSNSDTSKNVLISSDRLYETRICARGSSRLLDLEALFPRISCLELGNALFTIEDVPGLPGSLTVLRVELYFDEDAEGLFALLPRSLTNLDAKVFQHGNFCDFEPAVVRSCRREILGDSNNFVETSSTTSAKLSNDPLTPEEKLFFSANWKQVQQMVFMRIWNDPPPFLRKIRSLDTEIELRSIGLTFLPRTLEKIYLNISGSQLNLDASTVHTIPPNLKSWNASMFHSDYLRQLGAINWLRSLPKNLKSIDSADCMPISNTFELVSALPASITSIMDSNTTSKEFDWSQFRHQTLPLSTRLCWPPSLRIIFMEAFIFPIDMIKFLPRTLTTLSCSWDAPTFPEEKSDWPPLEVLFLENDSNPLVINDSLPPTLRHLFISGFLGSQIRGNHFEHLPSSLTDFYVRSVEKCTSPVPLIPISLPCRLQELYLDYWTFYMFESFPPTLTRLQLGNPGFIPSEDIFMGDDLFSTLPSGLVSFCACYYFSIPLSPHSFSTLRNLRRLGVDCWRSFDPKVLQTLSRRIRSLRITLTHLTEDDVPFFNPLWNIQTSYIRVIEDHEAADNLLQKHWKSLAK